MEGRFPEWMLRDLRNAVANQSVFGLCRLLSFLEPMCFYIVRGPIAGLPEKLDSCSWYRFVSIFSNG